MAISFVGSKTFTHAAITAQSVSLTDLKDESNNNATLLHGDYVIINYAISTANVDRSNAEMTPSGYTEVVSTNLYANDSNDANQLVSYKKMGTTPDTTVDIPASNATTAGVAVTIYAFRGVDQTTPLDVTPTTATGTNTGVANCPSITPSTAGAWIVGHGAAGVAAGAVFTNPAGMSTTTNHFRSATITSTTTDANVGTCLKTDWSSGAYDIAAFGGSTTTNTGSWCATTIVLRPQAPIVATPTTASLVLTEFAPTVTVSDNKTATPTTKALVITVYAPVVTVEYPWVVVSDTIPGTDRTHTATGLTTDVTYEFRVRALYPAASDWSNIAEGTPTGNIVATPTTKALALTTFAPTVTTPQTVTPTTLSLALTTFVPTVRTPVVCTPTTATLVISSFPPTVTTPQTVTPTTTALALTTFAPTVTVNGSVTAVPTTATLALAVFAPTVTVAGNTTVTPTTKALALTTYPPIVTGPIAICSLAGVVSSGELLVDRDIVSGTVTVEAVAWHIDGIASVELKATDGSTTVTSTQTVMTDSAYFDHRYFFDSLQKVAVYKASLNLSTLADGAITISAVATPNGASTGNRVKTVSWTLWNNTGGTKTKVQKYVDGSAGNDTTGDGSSGNPWATLAKGIQHYEGLGGSSWFELFCRNVDTTDFTGVTGVQTVNIRPTIRSWSGDVTELILDPGVESFEIQHVRLVAVTLEINSYHWNWWSVLSNPTVELVNCRIFSPNGQLGTGVGGYNNNDDYGFRMHGCYVEDFPGRPFFETGFVRNCTSNATATDCIRDPHNLVMCVQGENSIDPADTHPDGLQIAFYNNNLIVYNVRFLDIEGELLFVRLELAENIALINILAVQTTKLQYLAHWAENTTPDTWYEHMLIGNLTLPNAHLMYDTDNIGTNLVFDSIIANDMRLLQSENNVGAVHSIEPSGGAGDGWTDRTGSFDDYTTSPTNPFAKGSIANYNAAQAEYRPTLAALLNRTPIAWTPYDVYGRSFGGDELGAISQNPVVIPTTRALTLTPFAPSVSTPRLVVPTTKALVIATFPPTVTATANVLVTPTTASLTLTRFAPSVTAGDAVEVVPDNATLVLTTFPPTVSTPQTVTPTVASLALTEFAPSISTPRLVTPTTAALALTTYASVVATPRTVVPGTATLTLATFVPTVSTPILATPTTATLTLTELSPTVTITGNVTVVPPTATLTLNSFAPTVTAGGAVAVVPATAALALSTLQPTVSTPTVVTIISASLSLTTYSPNILLPIVVTPQSADLELTSYSPSINIGLTFVPFWSQNSNILIGL